MKRRATIGALVVGLASCGGDDSTETARPAPTPTTEAPSTPTPGPQSALPPEFLECMADQGYDLEQGEDLHAAPMELLQKCFGVLHGETP